MASIAHARQLAILQIVREAGQITRGQLARRTGLSPSLVSRLTSNLLGRRILCEDGKSEAEGGRPSDLLAINATAGYVIGLDIGATRQRAIVSDLRGAVVAQLVEPTQRAAERDSILANIEGLASRVIARGHLTPDQILGLGLGLRAIVDPRAGVVRAWPSPPSWSSAWTDFPIRDALAARVPWAHIAVDDTVRALGLAEARYGHGTSGDDFLYVIAGTGIGAAIMLGGVPYLGPNHVAGEIGHVRLTDQPIPCKCGNTGCLETLASTGAILERARERLDESDILSSLRPRHQELTIEQIIEHGEQGDRLAYQLLVEAGEYLGCGLALALNMLAPRLIVLGGPLATSHTFLAAAQRMMKLRALSQASWDTRLIPSKLGDLAGARGTATLALDSLFGEGSTNILALM